MTELYTEVFDEDSKLYPVINLKPKLKVPQLWQLSVPGNDNLVARMVSYMSEGDALKQVKQGDKYAHVILMSLSKAGTPAELKGGLGSDPIGAMNTLFNTVYSVVKKLHMDAIMFRFPAKKMVGQERAIQRVIKRLCMSSTGGKFVPLDALYQFTGKHAYILVYRKTKPLEDISGIPGINADLYTKVSSDVGEVFVNKKSGDKVTKAEAIAGSIASVESTRTDRLVINKTKLSRRAAVQAISVSPDSYVYSRTDEFLTTASKLSDKGEGRLLSTEIRTELAVMTKGSTSGQTLVNLTKDLLSSYPLNITSPEKAQKAADSLATKLKGVNMASTKAMKLAVTTINENIDDYKDRFIADYLKEISGSGLSKEDALERAGIAFGVRKSNMLNNFLNRWAGMIAVNIAPVLQEHVSDLKPKQKRAIKEYTGSGYTDINCVLLGRDLSVDGDGIMSEEEVYKAIDTLDSAFLDGDKLPEGTVLYRGQKLRRPIFEQSVKEKLFMFRNYVSTSMYPIIFGGWTANVSAALDDSGEALSKMDKNVEHPFASNTMDQNAPAETQMTQRIAVAWAISGADKIKVIIPGKIAPHPSECEVILPRGVVLKMDSVAIGTAANEGMRNQRYIEATVMTSDQLDEAIIYDGDVLLETGELVVYDGDAKVEVSSFAEYTKSIRSDPNKEAAVIMASSFNLDLIPQKFVL